MAANGGLWLILDAERNVERRESDMEDSNYMEKRKYMQVSEIKGVFLSEEGVILIPGVDGKEFGIQTYWTITWQIRK